MTTTTNSDNNPDQAGQERPLDPNREIDCLVAAKLGLRVVDKFWNCNIDPEAGYIDPLYYVDPDFEEGYTGIMYLRHPVYLRVADWAELLTFEDGSLGWIYEGGEKHIAWPPQPNTRDDYYNGRLECYDLAAVPHYSENLNEAWEIVKFAIEKGFSFNLQKEDFATWWDCDFSKTHTYWAREDTAPLSICKAFLNIKLEERKEDERG